MLLDQAEDGSWLMLWNIFVSLTDAEEIRPTRLRAINQAAFSEITNWFWLHVTETFIDMLFRVAKLVTFSYFSKSPCNGISYCCSLRCSPTEISFYSLPPCWEDPSFNQIVPLCFVGINITENRIFIKANLFEPMWTTDSGCFTWFTFFSALMESSRLPSSNQKLTNK